MWNFWYAVEDYAYEISSCLYGVASKGLEFVDVKIDRFFDRLRQNKCRVGDYVFAPGEAWKDEEGSIRACLKGGRVAIVTGLDKSYNGNQSNHWM